jgi:hypothetical protein
LDLDNYRIQDIGERIDVALKGIVPRSATGLHGASGSQSDQRVEPYK